MIKSLKDNPILAQQMSHARWPSFRTTWLTSAGLTVIGLVVTISAYVISPDGEIGSILFVPFVILLIETLLLVFGPLIAAVIAVTATVRAVDTEAYQMMRLSQLSDRDIVNGYLAGAVFRLRSLWMVVVGLLLPLVMVLTHLGVIFVIVFACLVASPDTRRNCVSPSPSAIFIGQAAIALIATMLYAILFIAWNWLSITLSVWMAFRYHHMGKVMARSLLYLVIAIATQIGVLLLFDGSHNWALLLTLLVFVIGDFVLSLIAYRKAVKLVNPSGESV